MFVPTLDLAKLLQKLIIEGKISPENAADYLRVQVIINAALTEQMEAAAKMFDAMIPIVATEGTATG